MIRCEELLKRVSPRHVHFVEQIVADAFAYVAAYLWDGTFEREGFDLTANDLWVNFVGNTVTESLYLAALADPDAEMQLGSGPGASSSDAAYLRLLIASGISQAAGAGDLTRVVAEISHHAMLAWERREQFSDAREVAVELVASTLHFLASRGGDDEKLAEIWESAIATEMSDLAGAVPFLQSPEYLDLAGMQPLALWFPLHGEGRFRWWTSVAQGVEAIPVEIIRPRLDPDWIGRSAPVVEIAEAGESPSGPWRITAPASWMEELGCDVSSWPDRISGHVVLPDLLVARDGECFSPITDPSVRRA